MERLIKLLEKADHCVALTGAGVSTFSGIPDFRGKGGIYSKFDADKIFSLDHFFENPSYFYSMSEDFIYNLDQRKPALPHIILADMETRGFVKAIITQNIDMLHQKAMSQNVIEIHGSPRTHSCIKCGTKYDYEDIASRVHNREIPPYCDKCNGLIKPDIIYYGESLKKEAIENAIEEACMADLFIAVGTTLVVQPAASLPFYSLDRGGKLVIVNDMETPLDRYAELKYPDIGDVFNHIRSTLLE